MLQAWPPHRAASSDVTGASCSGDKRSGSQVVKDSVRGCDVSVCFCSLPSHACFAFQSLLSHQKLPRPSDLPILLQKLAILSPKGI